ncbi:MAG: hypothetical protein MJA30_13425 [Cytophagales bacterium]|nr:hypothetical protein [Cytophagales bacterium]
MKMSVFRLLLPGIVVAEGALLYFVLSQFPGLTLEQRLLIGAGVLASNILPAGLIFYGKKRKQEFHATLANVTREHSLQAQQLENSEFPKHLQEMSFNETSHESFGLEGLYSRDALGKQHVLALGRWVVTSAGLGTTSARRTKTFTKLYWWGHSDRWDFPELTIGLRMLPDFLLSQAGIHTDQLVKLTHPSETFRKKFLVVSPQTDQAKAFLERHPGTFFDLFTDWKPFWELRLHGDRLCLSVQRSSGWFSRQEIELLVARGKNVQSALESQSS